MHTSRFVVDGQQYLIHHNNDWSGKAEVWLVNKVEQDSQLVASLPGKLFVACGRDQAFKDAIMALEQLE